MLDYYSVIFLLVACMVLYHLLTYNKRYFKNMANKPSVCESPIESRMYNALRREGISAIPQYQIGRYRLDFAVFEAGKKINIECDGKAFYSSLRQRARDRKRDKFMRDHGWIVMRFTGSQINRGAGSCARKVKSAIGYCN